MLYNIITQYSPCQSVFLKKALFEVKIFNSVIASAALLAIGRRAEQNDQREDLQSAEQHFERKDDFGERRISPEVCRGADEIEARTDVADAGKRRGEIRQEVPEAFDGDEQGAGDEDRDPGHEEYAHAVYNAAFYGRAFELDRYDLARMHHFAKIRRGGFNEDQDSRHFHTARRGARHTAHRHQEKQD